jgi:hypothetical protein
MDQVLQDELFEKYPEFFSNKDLGPRNSCMAFGITCGNGWHDLINSICQIIASLNKNIKERNRLIAGNNEEIIDFKFDQIKEKFGGLRVYYSGGDDFIRGLVRMAETMSYKTCEVCGNKGKPNKGGWISTLCDSCRSKNEQGL